MRPGRLIRAAQRLAAALGEGSALAGGLAVAAWGEVRATRDVDFVTSRPLAEVERALTASGVAYAVRKGDPLSGDLPWVVAGELEGASFQVFAPRGGARFEVVSVSPADVDGPPIPVVSLRDLLRLKLEAAGSKDLWDVARLLRRHPRDLAYALALAGQLGVLRELEPWLGQE